MTRRFKIHKNTSILDISKWRPTVDASIIFEITLASSFQLLAEGGALGMLRDFEMKSILIQLVIQNSPIKSDMSHEIDGSKLSPLLSTIFGLELIYLSKSVEDRNDSTHKNWRNLIGNYIWKKVLFERGVIESGKVKYLVCRHGYEIPGVLRSQTNPAEFPRFDYFQQKIRPLISSFRDTAAGTSSTEDHLIEWIFHTAENAFEHAFETYENNLPIPIRGYRGIILQKIKIEMGIASSVEHRDDLPDIVKNFINQRIEGHAIDRHGIINIATVVDLGAGIQNTLPGDNIDQTDDNRLQHAFKDGVTRKNTTIESAGYGLGHMVSAARNLKALIYIISANKIAYYDFADEDDKDIPGCDLRLSPLVDISKSSGTAVSILWAYDPANADQLRLDDCVK